MSEDVKNEQTEQEEVATQEVVEETTEETVEAEVAETEESEAPEETTEEKEEETVAEETEDAASEEAANEETLTHVFSGDVEGEVYTYDQLESPSDEYTADEYNELMGMYENTLNEIEEKEIVTGRVVSIDEKYVVIDIGFKSEGIIAVNEFSSSVLENMGPGDEVDVFLDRVEDKEGQLILSRRKADILQAWEKIEAAHETQEVVEGLIKRRIKGGMVVDLFGIDAFLPGSQIDVRPVRDFDAYVNKTMEFAVVKLNMAAENVVVSHRALIESDLEEQREQILDTIESGQVLEGAVKNITDFGVFIDLGGVDGLLHITDLSWGRVDNPNEIVQLDQRLNVAVIDFDERSKRVSLGLKQLQPHPWESIQEKYPESMKVQGRVVSIADYGAFIELEKGVEGLIHISEMSWTQHIKHPSQLVEKDDVVECIVLNINEDEKKISLGVKQLTKDPWADILERFPIGSKHKGIVRNLTNFGVFVELEPGIDGLIHVSDLSWEDKVEHPNEVVSKDQEIDVVILGVDFDNRRITLGHKQVLENPWEQYAREYAPGTEVKGEVVKVTDRGAFVKLPLGVEAFLNLTKAVEPEFKEGQEVEAFIFKFDEAGKSIDLSQLDSDQKKAKTVKKKADKKANMETGAPTLGEMSGLGALKEKMEAEEKAAAEEASKKSAKKAEAKKEEEASEEE
ncbi:MAG: 30S ribosomal protein S1 [Balneolaceae bacterium]|nr:30S ribosomal protein S1 [Balneolaceae bacterium]MBO6547586.1 30S ribosomal protein S1 [Balneolaceae bacterium]MBO6648097.1 30S ribosomal protein S1 [Balneolaceae bacterium]